MGPYKGSVDLGARLRRQRKNRGLNQKEAADEVGVSQPRWSRWEDGKAMPDPVDDFPAVAKFLGITREEVFELAFRLGLANEDRLARIEASVAEIRTLLLHSAERDPAPPGAGS